MEEEKSPQIRTNQGVASYGDNVDNVDNFVEIRRLCTKRFAKHHKIAKLKNQQNYVDKVDNLFAENRFADFYDISGTHSYQQVAVHTFFQ